MALERLFATWRSVYVNDIDAKTAPPEGHGSIFERLYQADAPEIETGILWRGERVFAMLNAYPYGSGHLMVLPNVAIPDLEVLDPDTQVELWEGVRLAVVAVKAAYQPDGVNIGMNLGRGGGAGVPQHIHVHVLPRWIGDTNFMTSVFEARVLPEGLDITYQKLVDAWPAS
jgi:diadenosine tetraphosphate (Ap4A) HIT family hydrolase